MRRYILPAAGALAVASPCCARADLQLNERGPVAFLQSDRLQPGDEDTFAAFLAKPRPTPLRIVYLDSRGGATRVGMAIGEMIRRAGLDTAFDADHGRCVSACTTVFVGGVHRYYIGGDHVQDGIATHYGLGFHPSNGGPNGEDRINAYYETMGVPGAAKLRYRVYTRDTVTESATGERNPRKLFFASGRSALDAGVATSIQAPEDKALRE